MCVCVFGEGVWKCIQCIVHKCAVFWTDETLKSVLLFAKIFYFVTAELLPVTHRYDDMTDGLCFKTHNSSAFQNQCATFLSAV